mmetsp:Transcript_20083/g.17204  ORF Transcript_20083/g.17204 Transcript_20083/m.17204 type:complete len:133 (-) Transcript_20083:7-405(-)
MERFLLTLKLDNDQWLAIRTSFNSEWPQLNILLDNRVIKFSTDQSLSIENGVSGVSGNLILGSITNQFFSIGETNIRRSGSVTLVVGNDFDSIIHPDTNARVSGTKINTNGSSITGLLFFAHFLKICFWKII